MRVLAVGIVPPRPTSVPAAWTWAAGMAIVGAMICRPPRRRALLLPAALLAAAAGLAGCSGGIEKETPDAVWIREPFLGIGDPQATADAHCRKYGKTAVYQGRLGANTNPTYVPILAYDCR